MENWHIVLIIAFAVVIGVFLLRDRITWLKIGKKGLEMKAPTTTPGEMKLKNIEGKEGIGLEQNTNGNMSVDGGKTEGIFSAKNTAPPK